MVTGDIGIERLGIGGKAKRWSIPLRSRCTWAGNLDEETCPPLRRQVRHSGFSLSIAQRPQNQKGHPDQQGAPWIHPPEDKTAKRSIPAPSMIAHSLGISKVKVFLPVPRSLKRHSPSISFPFPEALREIFTCTSSIDEGGLGISA